MLPGGTPTKRMPYLLLEGETLFPSGEHLLKVCPGYISPQPSTCISCSVS